MPMLEQQGFKFNLPDLIQRIWRYALGQRGLNKVISPFTPQEIQQRQQAQVQAALSNMGKGGGGSKSNGTAGLSYTQPSASSGYINQG